MIEKPKLLEWHYGRLFFAYRRKYSEYINEYCGDDLWHMWECWSVCFGHEPGSGLFNIENLRYDGHTYKSITLFGLTFGLHYSYDCEEKK